MYRHLYSLRVIMFILFSIPCMVSGAASKVTVVTDEWANFTNADGTGYYLELLERIYPAPEYELDISFMPYARSLIMVKNNKADVVLGIYQNELPKNQLSQYVVERDLVKVAR